MAKAATEKKTDEKKNTAMLEVPLAESIEKHYCAEHVQLFLTRDQAVMLRRVQDGLDASGATTVTRGNNEAHVSKPALAVYWMLENLKA